MRHTKKNYFIWLKWDIFKSLLEHYFLKEIMQKQFLSYNFLQFVNVNIYYLVDFSTKADVKITLSVCLLYLCHRILQFFFNEILLNI